MCKNLNEGAWISLILRLSFVLLWGTAAIAKFIGGLDKVVMAYQAMFQGSFLPMPLVMLHAHTIAYVEALLAIWLLLGIRLKMAWVVSALVLVSLAFGMLVAKNGPTTAENYFYVFMACVGLYFSSHDQLNVSCLIKK